MVAFNTQNFDTVLEVVCRQCSGKHVIFVKMADYIDWKNDKGFIQDLLPYLSDSDRELLISSICGQCFDNMFPS